MFALCLADFAHKRECLLPSAQTSTVTWTPVTVLCSLPGVPKLTAHKVSRYQATELMPLASRRLMTGLKFFTTLIFQTFHISWLLLFTVPWTCPLVGSSTTKTLVYFPERGVLCLIACRWWASALL